MPITIFIADDHHILRQGLRSLLEDDPDFEIVGDAAEGKEAIRRVGEVRPCVLVLDLMMPDVNGFEVLRRVKKKSPATKTVVLSMHSDRVYVRTAFAAGALGYVVKHSSFEEMSVAIRNVAAGKRYVSSSLWPGIGGVREDDPIDTLTPREMEILEWTVSGQSSSEVGRRLSISPRTVETHRAHLMEKLGVRNQRELVRFVTERRLGVRIDDPLLPDD